MQPDKVASLRAMFAQNGPIKRIKVSSWDRASRGYFIAKIFYFLSVFVKNRDPAALNERVANLFDFMFRNLGLKKSENFNVTQLSLTFEAKS